MHSCMQVYLHFLNKKSPWITFRSYSTVFCPFSLHGNRSTVNAIHAKNLHSHVWRFLAHVLEYQWHSGVFQILCLYIHAAFHYLVNYNYLYKCMYQYVQVYVFIQVYVGILYIIYITICILYADIKWILGYLQIKRHKNQSVPFDLAPKGILLLVLV